MRKPGDMQTRVAARWVGLALASLIAAALALRPAGALAWGAKGHEAVALVANGLLVPPARARVDALLAMEPGATLASISSWADATRDRTTAAWHFVNMPRDAGCVYVRERDCPTGQCVVEALAAQIRRLNAPSPSDQLEALKYVVHLIADIHQPLHAAFADDRGGNAYQLQAFGRGTNLHAVWDSQLLGTGNTKLTVLAGKLAGRPVVSESFSIAPAEWARESCMIASRPDFYPPRALTEDYVRTFEQIAQQRIYAAGQRLAGTLNAAFGVSPSK